MDNRGKRSNRIFKGGLCLLVLVISLVFSTVWAEKAPDFVLKDLKGERFRLKDHSGRPVLLVFSTSWCPACAAEIPRLQKLYDKYEKSGLIMLNVNIMETKEKAARFSEKYKLPYPTVLDSQGKVAGLYQIRGVPSLVLLDRNGRIICRPCVVVEGHLEKILAKDKKQ